ncbi:MAG: class I SAM-dependent methyltransferase [Chlamydiales bacterium]|nr:class I SAM-dependent methyltransferase [Chlamydiales bacterium]
MDLKNRQKLADQARNLLTLDENYCNSGDCMRLSVCISIVFLWGNMLFASQNLSHEQRENSFLESKQLLIDKILSRGDLPHISMNDQLDLLDQLCEFDLGKFLVERGGLDGCWTQYVVQYPEKKEAFKSTLGSLEAFLLNSAPTCLATQERFKIFKFKIQSFVKEGCHLASIPCGVMGDLLDLDFSNIHEFSLTGIDLDPQSIALAKEYAIAKNIDKHCHFSVCDAWQVNTEEKFDVIASNGLNIYELDDKKVVLLYRQFYDALNDNGILVTSFLTPPPIPGKLSEWKLSEVNQKDALLQKIIFADILCAKWQVYRTEAQTKEQLEEAGFQEIEVIHDRANLFPTVVAKRTRKP